MLSFQQEMQNLISIRESSVMRLPSPAGKVANGNRLRFVSRMRRAHGVFVRSDKRAGIFPRRSLGATKMKSQTSERWLLKPTFGRRSSGAGDLFAPASGHGLFKPAVWPALAWGDEDEKPNDRTSAVQTPLAGRPSPYPSPAERRSWPQEALMSAPRVRRTVARMPFCSRTAAKRRTEARSLW